MSAVTTAKLALSAIGVIILGWGMRIDDPTVRWVGIGFLAAAFLTRFAKRPTATDDDHTGAE